MRTPQLSFSPKNHRGHSTGMSMQPVLIGIIIAAVCCAATTAPALGIGTCDPARDVCINVITDSAIPQHTQVQSNISYDVNRTHSQLSEEYDWVNPNKTYSAVNLPLNLLSSSHVKNLTYAITQINQQPQADCKVSLPLGLKAMPTTVTFKLSLDHRTNLFVCETFQ